MELLLWIYGVPFVGCWIYLVFQMYQGAGLRYVRAEEVAAVLMVIVISFIPILNALFAYDMWKDELTTRWRRRKWT